jgi:hypothetical protein
MNKLNTLVMIILLFGVAIAPSTGSRMSNDDTTPPETTYDLIPDKPEGENGYYIDNVTVMLNATDDMSGVKEIRYRIDGESWKIISGDYGSFVIDIDGNDLRIEYYAIDNVGNEEQIKSFFIDIDKTPPDPVDVEVIVIEENGRYILVFKIKGYDNCSGIDRVEMLINEGLHETVTGTGPTYTLEIQWTETIKSITITLVLYDRAGHSATINISFQDYFLFGRIENLTMKEALFIFNAVQLLVIHFKPFTLSLYNSGEEIQVFKPKLEFFNTRFISGFFMMIIVTI